MVAIGALFFWGGLRADAYFGWSPWGMLGGLFLGILAGMGYFVNQVRRMDEDLRAEPSDDPEEDHDLDESA